MKLPETFGYAPLLRRAMDGFGARLRFTQRIKRQYRRLLAGKPLSPAQIRRVELVVGHHIFSS